MELKSGRAKEQLYSKQSRRQQLLTLVTSAPNNVALFYTKACVANLSTNALQQIFESGHVASLLGRIKQ